ncbi:hypothetical protein UCH007_00730 [Dehalococcoides sp. UCH007]|nr:hypothetical protein UCH007_00730 [Dehalococcoides sp. UCH007]
MVIVLTSNSVINLDSEIVYGITARQIEFYKEAAVVCFYKQDHTSGVKMEFSGIFNGEYILVWNNFPRDSEHSWKDLQEAIEYGACAIACIMITKITPFNYIERSQKGTGFDFFIGNTSDETLIFNNKVKLEVSGILSGDDTDINNRVKLKTNQINKYDNNSGYVFVVEFSKPKSCIKEV